MFIELKNISKKYDGRPVIKDLSFRFEPGRIYVIKGVSGCGKTTLLNIISGIDTEFEGTIEKETGDLAGTGYIFQQSLLVGTLTVRDNLHLVSGDTHRIEDLCKAFGVHDLLDRFPDQISGGERQRISVIRSVLENPALLICDEPTASLDGENSKNEAKTIAGLKSDDRIIIIATHDPYFDIYADVIIDLTYGKITGITKKDMPETGENKPGMHEEPEKEKDPKKSLQGKTNDGGKKLSAYRYACGKNRRFYASAALVPVIAAFLLVFLVSSVQHSFGREYIRVLSSSWPTDMVVMENFRKETVAHKEDMIFFENYQVTEDDIKALYLPYEKASVLSADGMIEYGHFPENNDQVLLSPQAFERLFGDNKPEERIGETFEYAGHTFTLAGVVKAYDNETEKTLFKDVYYRRKAEGSVIYIPYDTIKNIGMIEESEFCVAAYPDLIDHPSIHEEINASRGGEVNPFLAEVESTKDMINRVTVFITGLFIIAVFIACLFLQLNIMAELGYRKKEFGYLQIFGVSKKRVRSFVLMEYKLKLLAGLAWAAGIYALILVIYRIIMGGWAVFNLLHILPVMVFFAGSYLFTARICTGRFLKRSVLELIG